jgi:epsilon-lactone hydrolase
VITRSDPGALLLYAGGHDLRDPYVSPVFGDFSRGFPPTLLASGTRDILLSDTVRLHRALRAANIPAELHVFEAAPHVFFRGQAPEDRELDREVRDFIERTCPSRHG